MKNKLSIYRYIGLFSLLLIFGCDSELDIQPQQSISTEIALSDDQGVKTAVIGAYDILSGGNLWGGHAYLSGIYASSGDVVFTGTFSTLAEIFDKTIFVQNGSVTGRWSGPYAANNLCNNILESLDVVNDADRAQVEAEARFIRAVAYFELVNFFGKTWVDGDPNVNLGVPIITSSTQSIDDLEVPRATVADVYALMITDLEFAKANLPEGNHPRANTYAASVMLSRIYLLQENFTAAQAEADRVISSGLYTLVPDYNALFNQSSITPEDIFAMEVTSQDGINDNITFFAGQNAGGRGDISINDAFVARFDTTDQRGQFFYFDDFGVRRTNKWRANATQDGNINIMRLAEMYLTRAECRFRDDDVQGATDDINVIRSRANAPLISNKDLSLETILNERYLELCFEDHYYRDIKRTRGNFGSIPYDDDRMVFPIPERELEVNSLLIQNDGY